MILPFRQNLVGFYQTGNEYHFPWTPVGLEESPEAVARYLCANIVSPSSAFCLCLVATSHGVSYYRATFDDFDSDESCALCWETLDALRRARCWRRGHFAALAYCGVASRREAFSQDNRSILGEFCVEDRASSQRCLCNLRSRQSKSTGEEKERKAGRSGRFIFQKLV